MLSKEQQFKILNVLQDKKLLSTEDYDKLKISVEQNEDVLQKIQDKKIVKNENLGKILADFFNLPFSQNTSDKPFNFPSL